MYKELRRSKHEREGGMQVHFETFLVVVACCEWTAV